MLMFQDVEGVFDAVGALKLGGSYLPHLGALLTKMGAAAPGFLGAIIGQPDGAVLPGKLVKAPSLHLQITCPLFICVTALASNLSFLETGDGLLSESKACCRTIGVRLQVIR